MQIQQLKEKNSVLFARPVYVKKFYVIQKDKRAAPVFFLCFQIISIQIFSYHNKKFDLAQMATQSPTCASGKGPK